MLPRPLTIADGELTPTLKVRRRTVANEYARLIDEMHRRGIERIVVGVDLRRRPRSGQDTSSTGRSE